MSSITYRHVKRLVKRMSRKNKTTKNNHKCTYRKDYRRKEGVWCYRGFRSSAKKAGRACSRSLALRWGSPLHTLLPRMTPYPPGSCQHQHHPLFTTLQNVNKQMSNRTMAVHEQLRVREKLNSKVRQETMYSVSRID